MERLIKSFKNFVINYDNGETGMVIGCLNIIINMMKIVDVEDYEVVKKLISFVDIVTTNELIDDDTRYDIYYRQIVPVLQILEDRYVDRTVKPVSEVVQEYLESNYDIEVHQSINNKDHIIDTLDSLNTDNLVEALNRVQLILQNHYINIVNNGNENGTKSLKDIQNIIDKLKESVYQNDSFHISN